MIRHRRLLTRLMITAVSTALLIGCAHQGARTQESTPESAAGAYTDLGLAYLKRGDVSRARQALTHAIALSPTDANALQGMALLSQRQGDSALAEQYYQQTLSEAPSMTQARNNYATFLFKQQRYPEACNQLERASADTEYARRAQLYANLGQCRLATGQLDRAAASLERARTLDPRYARTYLLEARLAQRRDNRAAAQQAVRQYQRLAGVDQESQSLLDELQNTRTQTVSPQTPVPASINNKDTAE